MYKKVFAGGLPSSYPSLDQRYANVTRNHSSHWVLSREPPPKVPPLHHQEATDGGSQLLVWLVGLLLAYGIFLLAEGLDFVTSWNLLGICFKLCAFLISLFLNKKGMLWGLPWWSSG